MCRLSWNLGSSTSWNPQGLSRPVMGLLYLYLYLLHMELAHHQVKHTKMSRQDWACNYRNTNKCAKSDGIWTCKIGICLSCVQSHGRIKYQRTSAVLWHWQTLCHAQQENNRLPHINQSRNTESYMQNSDLSFYTIKAVQKKWLEILNAKFLDSSLKLIPEGHLKIQHSVPWNCTRHNPI